MATVLQENLARNIVKNLKRKKPLNKKELVVSSGYGMTTAEKQIPAVFNQKGVQEELQNLGFSEDGAKKVVQEIMYNPKEKADARLKATDQVFKVQGSYKEGNVAIGNVIFLPLEIMEKHGINPSTEGNSERQTQIQSS